LPGSLGRAGNLVLPGSLGRAGNLDRAGSLDRAGAPERPGRSWTRLTVATQRAVRLRDGVRPI
jgi:hypothetical protein